MNNIQLEIIKKHKRKFISIDDMLTFLYETDNKLREEAYKNNNLKAVAKLDTVRWMKGIILEMNKNKVEEKVG